MYLDNQVGWCMTAWPSVIVLSSHQVPSCCFLIDQNLCCYQTCLCIYFMLAKFTLTSSKRRPRVTPLIIYVLRWLAQFVNT